MQIHRCPLRENSWNINRDSDILVKKHSIPITFSLTTVKKMSGSGKYQLPPPQMKLKIAKDNFEDPCNSRGKDLCMIDMIHIWLSM